mmetsp:Transcript_1847/g.6558  ORF Transcript_1847/g.6558 Transcript_1847/m.6558 type:complete len:338 (+) Transcript_1847:257-1270(+)
MTIEENLNIFNIKAQPPQEIEDLVSLVITIAVLLVLTAIPLTMFLKYSKEAVRVKQPMLLLLMMFSIYCWCVGGFFSYRMLKANSHFVCHMTCVWLLHYGILGFVSLLIVRVFNLTVLKVDISISAKESRSPMRNFVGWTAGFVLGMILFAIITILNVIFTITKSVRYDPKMQSCFFSKEAVPFRVGALFVWTAALGICAVCNLRIRRELRESTVLFVGMLLMAGSITVVMAITMFSIHYLRGMRIVTAVAPPLFFAAYFALGLGGKIVFKILTCNSKYFDRWLEKFQKKSVEHMLKQHLMDTGITDDDVSMASDDSDDDVLLSSNTARSNSFIGGT